MIALPDVQLVYLKEPSIQDDNEQLDCEPFC
jgi:hypothetical protein